MLKPLIAVSELYGLIFILYVLFIVFGVTKTDVLMQSICKLQDKDLILNEITHADPFVRKMQLFPQSFHSIGQVGNCKQIS